MEAKPSASIGSQSRQTAVTSERVDSAISAAVDWLLRSQTDEGYWAGELEGDTILESEYVITRAYCLLRSGMR